MLKPIMYWALLLVGGVNAIAYIYRFFNDIFLDIFMSIICAVCVLLCIITAVLVNLYRSAKHTSKKKDRLYNAMTSAQDTTEMARIISEELRTIDIRTEYFELKDHILSSTKSKIDLLSKGSLPAMAFWQMKVYYDIDTLYVPIAMKPAELCWQTHNCTTKQCACYGFGKDPKCWLNSHLTHRDRNCLNMQDKIKKCANCRAFQPVGLFVLSGKTFPGVVELLHEHAPIIASAYWRTGIESYLDSRIDYLQTHDESNVISKRGLLGNLKKLSGSNPSRGKSNCTCMIAIDRRTMLTDDYYEIIALYEELTIFVCSMSNDVARSSPVDIVIIFSDAEKTNVARKCSEISRRISKHDFSNDRKITVSIALAEIKCDENAETLIQKMRASLKDMTTVNSNIVFCIAEDLKDSKGRGELGRNYLAF